MQPIAYRRNKLVPSALRKDSSSEAQFGPADSTMEREASSQTTQEVNTRGLQITLNYFPNRANRRFA
jgi:hypothetical protein